jgi:hypothetical protein
VNYLPLSLGTLSTWKSLIPFYISLVSDILKTNNPAGESLQILGPCHLKETSKDTAALPRNRLQSTSMQEWGQDAGLDSRTWKC